MKKTLYIVLFFFFSLTSVRAQSPNYVINYNKVNGYNVDAEEFTTDETELFESTDDTVLRLGMGVSVLNDEYVFMFEPFGVAENLNLTLIKKSMREKSQEYSIHPITITLSNGSKIYWEKCLFWDVMQKENINNLPAIFNLPEVCVFSIYARSTPIDVYTRSEIESSVVIENLIRYNISSIQLGDDLFSNTENLQTKEIFQAIASAMREKGYKVSSEKSGSSTITSSITKNGLIGNEWKEKLSSIMDYVTDIYNNGDSYKGIKSGGKRNGFGIYKWKSGTYFLGYFGDGHYRNGILFSGDKYNSNCPGCVFFYGCFNEKGEKDGSGFCFDKNGNLLYCGEFEADKPTGNYKDFTIEDTNFLRFEYSEYKGKAYLGVTMNGVPVDGIGIYFWPDGRVWLGDFENGDRKGEGVELPYKGNLRYGEWDGDFFTPAK